MWLGREHVTSIFSNYPDSVCKTACLYSRLCTCFPLFTCSSWSNGIRSKTSRSPSLSPRRSRSPRRHSRSPRRSHSRSRSPSFTPPRKGKKWLPCYIYTEIPNCVQHFWSVWLIYTQCCLYSIYLYSGNSLQSWFVMSSLFCVSVNQAIFIARIFGLVRQYKISFYKRSQSFNLCYFVWSTQD